MCPRQVQEGRSCKSAWRDLGRHAVVDAVELRVVEDVERFPTEFESGLFIDGEALESTEVEVDTAWVVQSVPPNIAECEAGGDCKSVRVIKQRPSLSSVLIRRKARAWVAHQIRARACADSVTHSCIVANAGAAGHAEWKACLGHSDARDLPTAKEHMSKSSTAEKGHAVDVADREIMSQVEIRAGSIRGKVIGIHKRVVSPVRGIVDGMTVGVSEAQREIAHGTVTGDLQGVVM